MAWPPPTLSTNRTNATPQHDSHAADHNAANLAINDLVAMVASLITSVGRYGFTAVQGGQSVAAGQTVNLAWTGVSDPAWGAGPVFTVPSGQGGVYVGVLEVTGPEPPVNAHADIVLCMSGVLYVDYIPESKGSRHGHRIAGDDTRRADLHAGLQPARLVAVLLGVADHRARRRLGRRTDMPGRISELDELAAPDAADQIEVLDISDTTMAPTGTNKRAPVSALGISTEDAVDAVAAALVDDPPITISYDDTANTVTVAVTTFGTSADGVVPASGGGTINFLRADGTWAAPPIFGGTGGHASFTFNSNTTEPPTGNQLRINNASQTAATRMWVSQTSTDGMDVSIGLAKILAGHQIYIQDFDDASKWVKYTVTADGVDDGSYYDFADRLPLRAGERPVPDRRVPSRSPPAPSVSHPGGTTGQVLTKTSGTDYVVGWDNPGPDPPHAERPDRHHLHPRRRRREPDGHPLQRGGDHRHRCRRTRPPRSRSAPRSTSSGSASANPPSPPVPAPPSTPPPASSCGPATRRPPPRRSPPTTGSSSGIWRHDFRRDDGVLGRLRGLAPTSWSNRSTTSRTHPGHSTRPRRSSPDAPEPPPRPSATLND